MTTFHTDIAARSSFGHGIREKLAAFWAGLVAGVTTYHEGNRRIDEVRRLQALSDAELAERGIARDRIAHFVFRDLFGS
jgi:hypothetical protein